MKEKLLAAWALALDKIVTARAWKIPMPLADAFIPMLREAFLSRYCNPISPRMVFNDKSDLAGRVQNNTIYLVK